MFVEARKKFPKSDRHALPRQAFAKTLGNRFAQGPTGNELCDAVQAAHTQMTRSTLVQSLGRPQELSKDGDPHIGCVFDLSVLGAAVPDPDVAGAVRRPSITARMVVINVAKTSDCITIFWACCMYSDPDNGEANVAITPTGQYGVQFMFVRDSPTTRWTLQLNNKQHSGFTIAWLAPSGLLNNCANATEDQHETTK